LAFTEPSAVAPDPVLKLPVTVVHRSRSILLLTAPNDDGCSLLETDVDSRISGATALGSVRIGFRKSNLSTATSAATIRFKSLFYTAVTINHR
jgi:hypothetical protein